MNNDEKEKKMRSESYKKFMTAADLDLDEVSIILRSHLLSEYYLDHIILLNIKRGDILLDKRFYFLEKVHIVEALDVVPRIHIDSIKKLNKVRNSCAHNLDYRITEADIDHIGRPYGKEYTKVKIEHSTSIKELLHWTLAKPIVGLAAIAGI